MKSINWPKVQQVAYKMEITAKGLVSACENCKAVSLESLLHDYCLLLPLMFSELDDTEAEMFTEKAKRVIGETASGNFDGEPQDDEGGDSNE